ncbi:hypothetical protein B0J17DRAFT_575726, partial [Rhizoctonia solani]
WLALGTHPDLAYMLTRLGQAQSNPHPKHWMTLVHILQYLSINMNMGLLYFLHTNNVVGKSGK